MLRSVKLGDRGQRSEVRTTNLSGPGSAFSSSPVPSPLSRRSSVLSSVLCPLSSLLLVLCLPAALLAQAPIFPDQIGPYEKHTPTTLSTPDRALYDEYGLESSEQAIYVASDKAAPEKKQFTATAWRMHDSTGAMALFQSRRPSGATPAAFAPLAVTTSDGVIFEYGNYVIQFTGGQPDNADMPAFYNQLPKFENSPLPALSKALPSNDLVPNSERYLLGPVSLQRFLPEIPPSVAAFRLGAEAQLAKYNTSNGLMTMAIFDYPTPTMARDQAAEFQKIAGVVAKRTGPLVVVIPSPPDPDAAERLFGKITYQAQVTLNENTPNSEIKGFARDLINIFVLAGVVILLCIVAGFGYAGFRVLRRKVSKRQDPDAMIVLNIDKQTR
jgi:hypothetical protein